MGSRHPRGERDGGGGEERERPRAYRCGTSSSAESFMAGSFSGDGTHGTVAG